MLLQPGTMTLDPLTYIPLFFVLFVKPTSYEGPEKGLISGEELADVECFLTHIKCESNKVTFAGTDTNQLC